jgi:hypothetical protein
MIKRSQMNHNLVLKDSSLPDFRTIDVSHSVPSQAPTYPVPTFERLYDAKDLAIIKVKSRHARANPDIPYTKEEIVSMLANPVTETIDMLSKAVGYWLQDQMEGNERVAVTTDISTSSYSGPWHYQGNEGSCTAISFLNALSAIGVSPDIALITSLRNFAIGYGGVRQEGGMAKGEFLHLATTEHSNFALELPDIKCDLQPIPPREGEQLSGNPDLNRIHECFFKLMPCDPSLTLRGNAQLIRENIDKGSVIMVTVSDRFLPFGPQRREMHETTVCGYRTSEKGYMDVQIIDSDYGIFWMAIEDLSRAVAFGSAIIVRPKVPLVSPTLEAAPVNEEMSDTPLKL